MSRGFGLDRSLEAEISASGRAPDIAGAAGLLEIGESLGLVQFFKAGTDCDAKSLASQAGLPVEGVCDYLDALASAGLVERLSAHVFRPVDDFEEIKHQAGY